MADKILRPILYGLAVLFGLPGIIQLVSGDLSGIISILIGVALWYWAHKGSQARSKRKAMAIVDEARRYFDTINTAGEFPANQTSTIISREENPVLAACNAKLFELIVEHAQNYYGTPLHMGSTPIYFAHRTDTSSQHLRETSSGELAITPRELIFNGGTRSVDIPLDKIISIDIMADGFHISVTGHPKPLIFAVPNGVLWGSLVKNLARVKLEGRRLPAGLQLAIE